MEEILAMFDAKLQIPAESLVPKKLQRPVPDKLFREIKIGGVFVLVPSTNAIGIVIRHDLIREPSLDNLERMIENTE